VSGELAPVMLLTLNFLQLNPQAISIAHQSEILGRVLRFEFDSGDNDRRDGDALLCESFQIGMKSRFIHFDPFGVIL